MIGSIQPTASSSFGKNFVQQANQVSLYLKDSVFGRVALAALINTACYKPMSWMVDRIENRLSSTHESKRLSRNVLVFGGTAALLNMAQGYLLLGQRIGRVAALAVGIAMAAVMTFVYYYNAVPRTSQPQQTDNILPENKYHLYTALLRCKRETINHLLIGLGANQNQERVRIIDQHLDAWLNNIHQSLVRDIQSIPQDDSVPMDIQCDAEVKRLFDYYIEEFDFERGDRHLNLPDFEANFRYIFEKPLMDQSLFGLVINDVRSEIYTAINNFEGRLQYSDVDLEEFVQSIYSPTTPIQAVTILDSLNPIWTIILNLKENIHFSLLPKYPDEISMLIVDSKMPLSSPLEMQNHVKTCFESIFELAPHQTYKEMQAHVHNTFRSIFEAKRAGRNLTFVEVKRILREIAEQGTQVGMPLIAFPTHPHR